MARGFGVRLAGDFAAVFAGAFAARFAGAFAADLAAGFDFDLVVVLALVEVFRGVFATLAISCFLFDGTLNSSEEFPKRLDGQAVKIPMDSENRFHGQPISGG
ncbi:hypothetical protein [Parasphingorhabdus marina]|uniref:hypothetical protein n=1 Tax=Parasphingorhabdus marina TaxID=394732 RepID=UPI001EF40D9A|nr:hypothetical protein [Parasphingorhabdus marina]